MLKGIISFFRGRTPPSVKWENVRREIMDILEGAKVDFDVTPYYYKVTSGNKTWYWNRDTGAFDGASWDIP